MRNVRAEMNHIFSIQNINLTKAVFVFICVFLGFRLLSLPLSSSLCHWCARFSLYRRFRVYVSASQLHPHSYSSAMLPFPCCVNHPVVPLATVTSYSLLYPPHARVSFSAKAPPAYNNHFQLMMNSFSFRQVIMVYYVPFNGFCVVMHAKHNRRRLLH